jgi:hypothetical protein
VISAELPVITSYLLAFPRNCKARNDMGGPQVLLNYHERFPLVREGPADLSSLSIVERDGRHGAPCLCPRALRSLVVWGGGAVWRVV